MLGRLKIQSSFIFFKSASYFIASYVMGRAVKVATLRFSTGQVRYIDSRVAAVKAVGPSRRLRPELYKSLTIFWPN